MPRLQVCKEIIDCFFKLYEKKVKMLSVGGRFMLLKSVLGFLRIYYMSTLLMLDFVSKILEKLGAEIMKTII